MKSSRAVALVTGDSIARYGFEGGHPFGPDRHSVFIQELRARGLNSQVLHLEPRLATYEELCSFHTPRYVDFVRDRCTQGMGFLDGGDTPAQRGLFEAASFVVGATLVAVESIMRGEARRAFVPIAGLHHAARDAAAGFCIFNDIGVAIEQLRAVHQITRIGYVDIDAHHGDGVYYGFESDPQLCFADIHEDGRSLYPGTGASDEIGSGDARGIKLNIPVPAGATDQEFNHAWARVLEHLEKFKPEFLILQCGADSVAGDPLTHMHFSPNAHARAALDLCEFAERMGHGRVLGLGGGGYNRHNLAVAWVGVVQAMLA